MQNKSKALAALVGSRICHDLISPIGAISNGLELMSLSDQVSSDELALIVASVANANARVRLFRIVFGLANESQKIKSTEIDQVLRGVYTDSKISVDPFPTGEFPRLQVQAVLLAVMCVEQSVPYGGTLSVVQLENGWRIRAAGTRVNIDQTLWVLLGEEIIDDMPAPAGIQFAMLPELARSLNMTVQVEKDDQDVTISITA